MPVHHIGPMDSFETPCVAIVVTLCYFFTMLVAIPIACILVRYYPHCHGLACGKLVVHHIVVHLPLLGTHHHHLPLLVLLLVRHVVGGVSSLCCLCHCELLPTSITLWWWGSFVIGNKREEKKKSLHLFILKNYYYLFPLFPFFIFKFVSYSLYFSCFFKDD
jgi:hypothetical protein